MKVLAASKLRANLCFKVTVLFKGQYLKNNAF